jgi:hypothetical protein
MLYAPAMLYAPRDLGVVVALISVLVPFGEDNNSKIGGVWGVGVEGRVDRLATAVGGIA